VSTVEQTEQLCGDLHNLCTWAQDWLMLVFNLEKCKVTHFRFWDSSADYLLSLEKSQTTNEERDLRFIVSEDSKASKQ